MFSHWLLKQSVDCFIHKVLKFFDEFHLVSLAVDFWWSIFVFFIFLITCMICGWLICYFLLPYSPCMVAQFPCHFTSLWWRVSQSLFLCIWWNFFHCSLFHYSFCNVPDILCVWCFSSRFPYCFCFALWCRGLLSCILFTISSHVFVYWCTLCHTGCMVPLACSCSWLQCLPRLSIGI